MPVLPPDDELELVEILRTTDSALLPLVKSMLEAYGIPFVVHGEAGVNLFPLGDAGQRVTGRKTGAVVLVPKNRADDARALLEEKDNGDKSD